ncbi:odorant receptor 131-2-like [Betta splendens]|uniref:Odorant receptor 131-2-like n=1 Tax=Betta splendens TaxID=158456 RepID=A0A6P7PC04_BETSP|nr:odorant receptor 131-2-like [Betta splendens]
MQMCDGQIYFIFMSVHICFVFFNNFALFDKSNMQNLTNVSVNGTSNKSLSVIIKVCVVVPLFCIFSFCIVVMLHIFASHRQFLDTSRYILFASMLISDTLHVMFSVLLFLLVMAQVKISLGLCFPLLFITSATFKNTPFILATMSLERYVAIFYPLQRPVAWCSDRIWIIILVLWLLSSMFPIIEYSIGQHYHAANTFSTHVLCQLPTVNSLPIQTLFRTAVNVLCFAVVAIIIIFTYVRILLETRKMRQDKVSVSKATHTVLLHGFQLLLCMLAFTMPITEMLIVIIVDWLPDYIAFLNYCCFVLIPRFLSPLIYGFRDQSLRSYIGKTILCCSSKVECSVRGQIKDNFFPS